MKTNKKGVAGRRERRAFSAEFKAEAVRMIAAQRVSGLPLTQIGRELDVRPDQLRAWVRAARQERGPDVVGPGESLEQEVRRLRREVGVLRQEVKDNNVTVTIPLTCLSSQQAGDLISPYVRSNGSLYWVAKPPMRFISVRATPEERQTARALIAQFDRPGSTSCAP